MFAFPDSAISFIEDTFLLASAVSLGYQTQYIIQDLPPNWIIGFLEVYKQMMHCRIVFPFFDLMNAQFSLHFYVSFMFVCRICQQSL